MKKLLMILPSGGLAGELTGLLSDDFEIVVAENEEDGFKLLDDHLEEISAVLADLKLSKASGYIIVKRLASDKIFASIPIIALSDHAPIEEDVEGRIGGDEFMVFLRDIDSAKAEEHLAQKLEDETKRAFDNEDYAGLVTLSIGIAMYPKHGKTFEELYNAADQALYYVKEHGKGSYHMYDTD
ncbi:MAG: GGDEF domain-containing response regulator [Lachnospiraceae bacterium]|nr:GGDEF domain-containing response regulator [Lachnospiraceae bacterium]